MQDVPKNKFFRNARQRAANILKNKERLNHLLRVSADKIKEVNVRNIKNSSLVERVRVLIRMVRAYASGRYRGIKVTNLLLLVAAIVYFVTPLDFVPDFIPITGFVDDFTVVLWVYGKLQEEIDAYLAWENEQLA